MRNTTSEREGLNPYCGSLLAVVFMEILYIKNFPTPDLRYHLHSQCLVHVVCGISLIVLVAPRDFPAETETVKESSFEYCMTSCLHEWRQAKLSQL